MSASHPQKSDQRIAALGIVEPPPIHVELPAFRGSLALLFECVRERKVDLIGVPLAPICEAYLHYLIENETSVDAAAAALNALCYLVERKSWLLLPTNDPEPDEDEPLELPEPTAYEYAEVIKILRALQIERDQSFFRSTDGPDPFAVPFDLEDITTDDLARSYERLMRHAVPDPPEVLQKERRSLVEQMAVVLAALSKVFRPLEELIEAPFDRTGAVFFFLAMLELIRLGQVGIKKGEHGLVFGLKNER